MTEPQRTALILGGTGAVGSAVVRLLASKVPTIFTFHRSTALAQQIAHETQAHAIKLDLADASAIQDALQDLISQQRTPDILIHCAAVNPPSSWQDLDVATWDHLHAVNVRSAWIACQTLAPHLHHGGDMVFLGALDRTQSLPLPPPFAATQGALAAFTMALAKELGPRNIRVNMVALGLLNQGLSQSLDPQLLARYRTFSALQRNGTPEEIAPAILWLALDNTYINGKVIPVNGGI